MIIMELKIPMFAIIKSINRYNQHKTSKKKMGKLKGRSLEIIQTKACRQGKI